MTLSGAAIDRSFSEWGLAYVFSDPQRMPSVANHSQAYPVPLGPASALLTKSGPWPALKGSWS